MQAEAYNFSLNHQPISQSYEYFNICVYILTYMKNSSLQDWNYIVINIKVLGHRFASVRMSQKGYVAYTATEIS